MPFIKHLISNFFSTFVFQTNLINFTTFYLKITWSCTFVKFMFKTIYLMVGCQFWTRVHFCTASLLHERHFSRRGFFCTQDDFCTRRHFCTSVILAREEVFAQRVSFARGDTFARRLFCTHGLFCTRAHFFTANLLHGGSVFHEGTLFLGDSFAHRVIFAQHYFCTAFFHGNIYALRKFWTELYFTQFSQKKFE